MRGLTNHEPPTWMEDLAKADTSWRHRDARRWAAQNLAHRPLPNC
jgi:hypothetical protein